jgi:hypothetical protein
VWQAAAAGCGTIGPPFAFSVCALHRNLVWFEIQKTRTMPYQVTTNGQTATTQNRSWVPTSPVIINYIVTVTMYALVTPFVKEPRLMRRSLPSMRGIQTTHCCENRAVFVATQAKAIQHSSQGAVAAGLVRRKPLIEATDAACTML